MVGGCRSPITVPSYAAGCGSGGACALGDCCPTCRVSSAGGMPAGYERERLENFYAQTDVLPAEVRLRIVRACSFAGRTFSIGTAVQAGTWAPSGFLYQYCPTYEDASGCGPALPTTLALECTTLLGTARLRYPSAIVSKSGCSQQTLIIVGQGELEAPDGTPGDLLPAVAIVTIGGGGSCAGLGIAPLAMSVTVQIGAGSTALEDEV